MSKHPSWPRQGSTQESRLQRSIDSAREIFQLDELAARLAQAQQVRTNTTCRVL
ncbi:MAG: hypothetical protein ACOVN7_02410 [Rubrivivax sp.]